MILIQNQKSEWEREVGWGKGKLVGEEERKGNRSEERVGGHHSPHEYDDVPPTLHGPLTLDGPSGFWD